MGIDRACRPPRARERRDPGFLLPEGPPRAGPHRTSRALAPFSYLLAYVSHALKDIYDVHALDLQAVARSFGLSVPPKVDLNVKTSGRNARRRTHSSGRNFGGSASAGGKERYGAGGHSFSAQNPYGKREKGDRRQFSY